MLKPLHCLALFSVVTLSAAAPVTYSPDRGLHEARQLRQRVLPLDQPVLGIAVSDDGQNIYAVRHDPEPAVLRYTVPAADR
jgi:hypothetical protein